MVLLGRLGLETARIPHVDRHGLVWLERGRLYVEDGTLRFEAAASATPRRRRLRDPVPDALGDPDRPGQQRHPRRPAAPGPPRHRPGRGRRGRHAALHGRSPSGRTRAGSPAARRGSGPIPRPAPASPGECSPGASARCCRTRTRPCCAAWRAPASRSPTSSSPSATGCPGRAAATTATDPDAADLPNQAINHAVTCVEAAAAIAVAATATIPQLGFVHEDSSKAFILDITDLVRTSVTVPLAFADRPPLPGRPDPRRSSARCGARRARRSARRSWSTR